jgi:tetratricopeptide (TPR) repeat protein
VAIEVAFIAFGWFPRPPHFKSVRGADGAELKTAGHLLPQSYPRDPCAFAPHKQPGTLRVFMIGESSVHGFPYFPWSSIPGYLQLRLAQVLPHRRIEVINAGFPGYTSEHVAEVFEEALEYEPDLIILYCGHNEFMLAHHEEIADDTSIGRRFVRFLRERRITRALSRLLGLKPAEHVGVPFPADDLTAIHDAARVPPDLMAAGYQRYERHLRAMLQMARARGVPVLCCDLVSNLRHQPPHWVQFERLTGETERVRYRDDLRRALDLQEQQKTSEALALLDELAARDPGVASVEFARGRALLALDRPAEALQAYRRAKDLDGMPMRATTRLLDILERVTREEGAKLCDPWPDFIRRANQGVPGFDLLSDYCHPNLDGQYLLATVIMQALARENLLASGAEFDFAAELPRSDYERALGLMDPGFADAQVQQGNILIKQALLKNGYPPFLSEATRSYERALKYRPSCAGAQVGMGLVAVLRGDRTAALAAFDQAVLLDRNALRGLAQLARGVVELERRFDALGLQLGEDRVRPVDPPRRGP